MSIQSNFPAISPSLNLSFALTKALDPRITFTRASTGTFYGTQTAKAEENLLLQSQFASGWLNAGTATQTPNNTAAPDGTTTAALVASPATSDYVYQVPTTTIGLTYVFSFFVKNSTATISIYQVRTSSTAALGTLTWSGSTLSSVTAAVGTASFVDVGNGWYRVSVFYTALEAAARQRIYGGDGVSTTGNIFLWGAQLEQRSAVTAYTPTTTQPITNYVPQLQTAASGVARFDHNPITDESLGLLIEEQRTNLLLRSEEFETTWVNERSTEQTNVIIAPNGTLTGDKLVEDTTATNTHSIYQGVSGLTDSTTYIASFYLKAAERTKAVVAIMDKSATTRGMVFDLSAGTVSSYNADGITDSSIFGIQAVGNGWYRCWVGQSVGTGGFNPRAWVLLNNGTTISYTGNGYSGIFIWGAQLEAGAFPTSYIQTVASQVTRAADAASMTGANFSSWYNQAEGSFYVDYMLGSQAAGRGVLDANDAAGPSSNAIQMRYAGGGQAQYQVNAGGVNQANLAPSGFNTNGASYRRAIAYATNSFNQAINGALPSPEDTSGVTPFVNVLRIGSENIGANQLCGTIRKLSYYPLRCTNAQLQALTS
jgi:hypothetical protein